MVKKCIFKYLCVLFICTNISIAQITTVDYTMTVNSVKPVVKYQKLVFNQYESYYFELDSLKLNLEAKDNKGIPILELQKNFKHYYYLNFINDTLINQNSILDEPYLVYENIPKHKWILKDEYKTIGNYKCQKATLDFRGRAYIAWFTKDVQTRFGPWKLAGLPGLILLFTDSTGVFHVKATNLKTIPDKSLREEIELLEPKGKVISLKEFVPLKDNEINEYVKKFRAKMGVRSSSAFFEKPKSRQGFELIYEWEKP